jgi:hypothetical protein
MPTRNELEYVVILPNHDRSGFRLLALIGCHLQDPRMGPGSSAAHATSRPGLDEFLKKGVDINLMVDQVRLTCLSADVVLLLARLRCGGRWLQPYGTVPPQRPCFDGPWASIT